MAEQVLTRAGGGVGGTVVRCFAARGKVQKVMFRQTLIRAAQKRNLEAGATNVAADRNLVHFVLKGQGSAIDEIVTFMRSGKALNSWGARVDKLDELPITSSPTSLEKYQVTTGNVDSFNWKSGVRMYL